VVELPGNKPGMQPLHVEINFDKEKPHIFSYMLLYNTMRQFGAADDVE
jgi:hypothetical protein